MFNGLARQGLLRRTRGGAVSLALPVREIDLRSKQKANIRQKRYIAAKGLEFIRDSDNIYINAGTTTLELARLLKNENFRNLTVVTTALHIAAELLGSPKIELILTGGAIRPGVGSCVGPVAEAAIAALSFDAAFLGANHVSISQGALTLNLIIAPGRSGRPQCGLC